MDKLKLEQDVTGEEKGDSSKKKKDVARLLKVNYVCNIVFYCWASDYFTRKKMELHNGLNKH